MPTDIEVSIESALADLRDQQARLEKARDILTGNSRSASTNGAKSKPRTRARGAAKTNGRGSATKLQEAEIMHAIHANGQPASAGDIRHALKLTNKDSHRLSVKLGQMTTNGLLKRKGERRASRYTPA